MGRKQREKKARQQESKATRPAAAARPGRRGWVPWALGLAGLLVLATGVLAYYVYANRVKLMRVMVYSQAVQVHQDLARGAGKFSLDEGRRLADVLVDVQKLSNEPAMDVRVAGHLNFILQVSREIIKNGNLEPEELDKLEQLAAQARQVLQGQGRP